MINLSTNHSSLDDVQNLYERRPYPHYPLLAKPRWQDGYLGSRRWAQAMFNHSPSPGKARFLCIGCGEILPYIIAKWEQQDTKIECIDLSRRSLQRAKFRTSLTGRSIHYLQEDVTQWLSLSAKSTYDHIDAIGVLHHISHFKKTIENISHSLKPNGVLRVMVYNAEARKWIWELNRGFRDLKFRYQRDSDIIKARTILLTLCEDSPRLKQRITQLGPSSLFNHTRFADTFLHPYESRSPLTEWLQSFESFGLKPLGMFDRYAELDDLPNPLWSMPTREQLTERCKDLRFENNLELWLTKPGPLKKNLSSHKSSSIPWSLRFKFPPSQLDRFEETRHLPTPLRFKLWNALLYSVYNQSMPKNSADFLEKLEPNTLKRLSRIGFITPLIAKHLGLEKKLLEPIHDCMLPPTLEPSGDLDILTRLSKLLEPLEDVSDVQKKAAAGRFLRALT